MCLNRVSRNYGARSGSISNARSAEWLLARQHEAQKFQTAGTESLTARLKVETELRIRVHYSKRIGNGANSNRQNPSLELAPFRYLCMTRMDRLDKI